MEVYAGFLEHTDHHVGRLFDALERPGHPRGHARVLHHRRQRCESAEGTPHGTFNEILGVSTCGRLETAESLIEPHRRARRPEAYNHYAVGWAHAMDTPYQWTKQVASHWGGTRNGTIVHWPNGIKAKGEVRGQFHHVIDVAPTVLEAAGLPEPTSSTA